MTPKTLKLYIHIALLVISIFVYTYNTHKKSASVKTATEDVVQKTDEGNTFSLERIVDGDTIVVKNTQGEKQKVRILGINAPESVDPRRPVECFGKESAKFLEQVLIFGTAIHLQKDSSQVNIDKYERLIRYVEVAGVDVGKRSVEEGYAYEYIYSVPYERQTSYKKAETEARLGKKGLWSLCR